MKEDNELARKVSGIVKTYITNVVLVLENGISAENHLVVVFVLGNLNSI